MLTLDCAYFKTLSVINCRGLFKKTVNVSNTPFILTFKIIV